MSNRKSSTQKSEASDSSSQFHTCASDVGASSPEVSNSPPEASAPSSEASASSSEASASSSEASSSSAEASTSSSSSALKLSNFRFLSVLGEGSFGKVWFAHLKKNNTTCAVKAMRRSPSQAQPGQDGLTLFEREVGCMKRVDPSFPFIVRIFGHFSTSKHDFLVMEYLGCGDMFDHLLRYKPLAESHAKLYIAELGCALQHLHDRNIIYRDLKVENIVMAADGHLKLIDFGLSKEMTTKTTGTMAGSAHTMAPEVFAKEQYDYRADWYSLGVVMYEMLTGEPPFSQNLSDEYLFQRKVMLAPIPIPLHLTWQCQELLEMLLEKDPLDRLVSFEELLNHEWFEGYSRHKVMLKLHEPKYIPSARNSLTLAKFDPDYEHPGAKFYRNPTSDYIPAFLSGSPPDAPSPATSSPSFSVSDESDESQSDDLASDEPASDQLASTSPPPVDPTPDDPAPDESSEHPEE